MTVFHSFYSVIATPSITTLVTWKMQHFLLWKCYVINISCLQNRVLHTTELVGRVFQNAV